VTPERLDHLPADDPLALASRRDLRRVHRAMRSLTILKHAVSSLPASVPPRRILDLGAGDGSLMLRLARAMRPYWGQMQLTLLDRQYVLSPAVKEGFAELHWNVTVLCADALEWAQSPPTHRYDLCLTTLFLHHFDNTNLARLLSGVARHVDAFVACEPRRNNFADVGSRLIGFIGANEVTREDSVKSVAAGFKAMELTELWSAVPGEWRTDEYAAWPFTHCFRAYRANPSRQHHHER
jgi:SAM-dependent methyltransferase